MKTSARFLLFLAVALLAVVATTATEQQHHDQAECEVGEDGQCLGGGGGGGAPKEAEVVVEDPEPPISEAQTDDTCPDREHIIKCAGANLDRNENGKLDRVELDDAIKSLPWYGRGILKILGSTDKMMQKCDVDGDDAISMDYE